MNVEQGVGPHPKRLLELVKQLQDYVEASEDIPSWDADEIQRLLVSLQWAIEEPYHHA